MAGCRDISATFFEVVAVHVLDFSIDLLHFGLVVVELAERPEPHIALTGPILVWLSFM